MEKIYVLNHPEFIKRRNYITEKLNHQHIKYEIVDSYSPDEIDYDNLTKDWHLHYRIVIEQVGRYSYMNHPKKISPGSLSLVMKHIHCWKEQILNGYDWILILEDDCEISEDFDVLLENLMKEVNNTDGDLVMLGGFSDFISPNKQDGKLIHFDRLQKTRCTHSYLISKNAAKIMIDGFSIINNPIDIKMNEVIQINKLKVYWLEPGLKQIEII